MFGRLRLPAALTLCVLTLCCHAYGGASSGDGAATAGAQAAAVPAEAAASVESLAKYLTKSASGDAQKVRAIYDWEIRSIDYDVAAMTSGNLGDQSAEATLARRKGVCSGYARLFKALANAAGVEAVEVAGYSRGAGYVPGSALGSEPDHAWTAVKINGEWRLMDCTWAAGYLDSAKGFVRRLEDYYYLTPSDKFVYDHLPQDPKWQLSEQPISKEEFEQLVYLRPGFFRYGLGVVSHPKIEIVSDGNLTVTFSAPEDVLLMGRAGEANGRDDAAETFVQRDGDKLNLNASFADPGTYTLRLYAKKRGDAGNYDWAADYLVKVPEVSGVQSTFPEMTATYQETSARLCTPISGRLKAGSEEAFKIVAPGAQDVAVVVGQQWTKLEKHGDAWEGKISIKGSQVQVAAKFPGSNSFYVLLVYGVSS